MELHSAAKALIRRSTDGKYLLLTGSKWEENPQRSQKPDLPGGMIEPGEAIEEGLRRELMEEIGTDIGETKLQLVYAGTFVEPKENQSTVFLLYYAEVDDIDVTLSWEHESFDWIEADEVLALEIREPYPTIFAHFKTVGLL